MASLMESTVFCASARIEEPRVNDGKSGALV